MLDARATDLNLTSIPETARVRRNGALVGSIISLIYRYYFANYVNTERVLREIRRRCRARRDDAPNI